MLINPNFGLQISKQDIKTNQIVNYKPIRIHFIYTVLTMFIKTPKRVIIRLNYSVFLTFAFLNNFLVTYSKHLTIFDDFCQDEPLYTPYIKYYRGKVDAVKNGVPFRTHSPGFWSDIWEESMVNTYVCVNGPAWLYYRLTTSTTEVYEAPELRIFIHHCFIANPKPGPGLHEEEKTLLAILLVGDASDYRLPNIQLFTAPYKCSPVKADAAAGIIEVKCPTPPGQSPCEAKDALPCPAPSVPPGPACVDKPAITCPTVVYNTTSLMMIGDETECILNRGKLRTPIRIRTEPTIPPALPEDTDTAGTYCRMSYRAIAEQIVPDTVAPLATSAMINDVDIKIQGCYVPDNYTADRTKVIIDARVKEFELATADPTISELAVDKYFGTKLPAEYLPTKDTTSTEYTEEAINKEIKDKEAAIKLLTDAAAITTATGELIEIKLRNYIHNAFKEHEALAAIFKETVEAWKALKTESDTVDGLLTAANTADAAVNTTYEAWQAKVTDDTLKEAYETAKTAYDTAANAFEEAAKKLAPLVSVAEIQRAKLDLGVKRTTLAFESLIRAHATAATRKPAYVKPFEDLTDFQPLLITIKRSADLAIPKYPEKDIFTKTCGDLPKPKETCAQSKPETKRACQLLMARMGRFNRIATTATTTVRRKRAVEPGEEVTWDDPWRQQVLDLIADIYVTATAPILSRELTTGINRITRGYLTDFVEGTLQREKSEKVDPVVPVPVPAPAPSPGTKSASDPVVNADPAAKSADPESTAKSEPDPAAAKPADPDPAAKAEDPEPEAAKPDAAVRRRRSADSNSDAAPWYLKLFDLPPTDRLNRQTSLPIDQFSERGFSRGQRADPDAAAAAEPIAADPPAALPEPAAASPEPVAASATPIEPKALGSPPSAAVPGSAKIASSFKLPPPLPSRRPFWTMIIRALKKCKDMEKKLIFKKVTTGPREEFLYTKFHANGSMENIKVEHLLEQADQEFIFNWAIDTQFKIFATILGICMPAYELKIPLITARFFTYYTEDFLYPLAAEWVNNRDNAVLKAIFGEFYGAGTEEWLKLFMEASFISSGDVKYRPPRKLLVNGLTEANFFISGPMSGTAGIYS